MAFVPLSVAFALARDGFTLGLGPPESDAVFLGLRLSRAANPRLTLAM